MIQKYNPMNKKDLLNIKPGDLIERMLGFSIPVYLVVQEVTDDLIKAGWEFDRNTGLEVDDDIPVKVSYIRRVMNEEQKELLKTQKEIAYE